MKKERKMELATEEWEKAGFSSDDVEHQSERLNELADLVGLEVEDLLCLIYDYAVASGKGFVDALLEVMDNQTIIMDFYNTYQEEEIALKSNERGLSRAKLYQLRGLPVGMRIEAYNACPARERGFSLFPLRMPNKGDAYKEMRFDDVAILSALCCAYDAERCRSNKFFPVRSVWKVLHQSERWENEPHKDAFEESVKMSLERLNSSLCEQGKWFVSLTEQGIIMTEKPPFWRQLEESKSIMKIPTEMIGCKSRLDWCTKLYVARRVILSKYPNFPANINLTTLHNTTTPQATGKMVLGYLKSLERLTLIENPQLDGNNVKWVNLQKNGYFKQ